MDFDESKRISVEKLWSLAVYLDDRQRRLAERIKELDILDPKVGFLRRGHGCHFRDKLAMLAAHNDDDGFLMIPLDLR